MKRLILLAVLLLSMQLHAKSVRMSYAQPGYACHSYTETTYHNLCNSEATCLALFTCSYQQADFVAKASVTSETALLNRNTPFNKSQYFWSQPPKVPPVIPTDLSSAELVYLNDWLWCRWGVKLDAFSTNIMSNVLNSCIPSFSNLGADIKDLDLINETAPIQKSKYVRADKPEQDTPQYAVFPINLDSAKTSNTIQIDEPLLIDDAGYSGNLVVADQKGNKILDKPFQEIILLNGKVSDTDKETPTKLTPSSTFQKLYKDSCAIIINSAHPVVIQNITLSDFESGICIKRKTEVVLNKVTMWKVKTGIKITDKAGTMETDAAGNSTGFVPVDTANPNKATWILVENSLLLNWNNFIQLANGATSKPIDVVTYNSTIYGNTNFNQNMQHLVMLNGSIAESVVAPTWGEKNTPQLFIIGQNSENSNGLLKFNEDIAKKYPSNDGYSAIVYVKESDMENFKEAQILNGSDVQVSQNIATLSGVNTKDLGPQSQVMVALIPTNLSNDGRESAKTLFTAFVNQESGMKVPPVSFPYAYDNTIMGPNHSIYVCADQDNPTLNAKLQNPGITVNNPLKSGETVEIKLSPGPTKTIYLTYNDNAIHFSGNNVISLKNNGTFSAVSPESSVTLAFKKGSERPKIVIAPTDISTPCITFSGIQWDDENKIRIMDYNINKIAAITTKSVKGDSFWGGYINLNVNNFNNNLHNFSASLAALGKLASLNPEPGDGSDPSPKPTPIGSEDGSGPSPKPTPIGPEDGSGPSQSPPDGIKKPIPTGSVDLDDSLPKQSNDSTNTTSENNSGGSCGLIR